MHQQQRALIAFALSSFNVAEWRSYLQGVDDGAAVLNDVAPNLGLRPLVEDSLAALARRGALDARFFSALKRARPKRAAEIEELAADWDIRQSAPAFARLEEHEVQAWRHRLRRSRPFKSIWARLERYRKRRGVRFIWYLQGGYVSSEPVEHGSGPRPGARHRLILFEDRPEDLRIIVVLEVRPSHQRGRRLVPAGLDRVLVGAPEALLPPGVSAYVLGAPQTIALPWLVSRRLTLWAFPYRQQQGYETLCVHSCLWMAFEFQHAHMGHRRVGLGEIRTTRPNPTLLPPTGLDARDIQEIIRGAGFTPLEYRVDRSSEDKTDSSPGQGAGALSSLIGPTRSDLLSQRRAFKPVAFLEILHSYLDSQLPVVLVYERFGRVTDSTGSVIKVDKTSPTHHAVVVVGHTAYQHQVTGQDESSTNFYQRLGIYTTTAYVDRFVVHDDAVGPHMLMSAMGSGSHPLDDTDHLYEESVESNALAMFVPLPPGIHVPVERILPQVSHLLADETWRAHHARVVARALDNPKLPLPQVKAVSKLKQEYDRALDANELVLSVYLDRSARLKANVKDTPSMHVADQRAFLDEPMPRYVYVVELSTRSRMEGPTDREDTVIGELLFDPTVPIEERESSLILARLPGGLVTNQQRLVWVPSLSQDRVQWLRSNFDRYTAP